MTASNPPMFASCETEIDLPTRMGQIQIQVLRRPPLHAREVGGIRHRHPLVNGEQEQLDRLLAVHANSNPNPPRSDFSSASPTKHFLSQPSRLKAVVASRGNVLLAEPEGHYHEIIQRGATYLQEHATSARRARAINHGGALNQCLTRVWITSKSNTAITKLDA